MAGEIVKTSIHAPDFLNEPISYGKSFSRGIRVSCGAMTFLFISGTASINEKGTTVHLSNFLSQTERMFNNVTALLLSEGARWHDVAQTRFYLKDMRDYEQFNAARNAFYKQQSLDPFPASVCIRADLCRAELLIEMEAIAIIRQ